jgi:exosortase E/protease (VPEID-CTERM system)
MRSRPPSLDPLPLRAGAAATLLAVEVLSLSVVVDTQHLHARGGIAGLAAGFGAAGLQFLPLAAVLAVVFALKGGPAGWIAALVGTVNWRVSRTAAVAHLCAMGLFAGASVRLFRPDTARPFADWLAVATMAGALATFASAVAIFIPSAFWRSVLRRAPWAPVWAIAIAAAAVGMSRVPGSLAPIWLRLTFQATAAVLRLLRPGIQIDPAQCLIRDGGFEVTIGWQCSGYEGVALMFVFGSVWLFLFRSEFRFPRALLMIPAGMAAIWTLNCARMVTLFLIGVAGAPAVALGGFHSQAGWIAFVGLALAFSIASQRLSWIRAACPAAAAAQPPDHTTAYLLPFLAILAASMLAQAFSAGFEWAYPLRVVAAAGLLWRFRSAYTRLDWSMSLPAVGLGVAVFALWLAAERLLSPAAAPVAIPATLAAAGLAARWGWLFFRVAGAVVTVPIAEELAFRGYALRRLASPDFAAVDLRRFAWMPFLVSSLLFGLLHGQRWMVGVAAGMFLAEAARRRGSIGDSVAAHAVANLLLAAWVFATGDWRFW